MSPKLYVYAVTMGLLALATPAFSQNPLPVPTSSSLGAPADSHTLKAHVHGIAHLAVAVDAQDIVMDLEVPLVNLVGFEHKPENDTERTALSHASQTLGQADKLFKFNASATCSSTSVQIEMPTFEHDTHADVDARYHFSCKSVADLHSLQVKLFDVFHDIETLKTVYIDDDTQLAKTLSASDASLSLR